MSDDDNTTTEVISQLSKKQKDYSSYTHQDMIDLCNELLTNFRDRQYEWSNVSSWTLEEAKVFQVYQNGQDTPSKDAQFIMSGVKQSLSFIVSKFIGTCLKHYEYAHELETNGANVEKKKPDLLKKVREITMGDGSERCYSIHGPIPMPLPNQNCELYTLPTKKGEQPRPSNHTKLKSTSKDKDETITLILGAGNQPQLSLFDILQHSLVDRDVVLLKHHPLRPHLLKLYSILLEPLIKRGFFAQVLDSGVKEAEKILGDSRVGHVHVTGSIKTDRAIRSVISRSKPHLSPEEVDRFVSSELGAVTPCILSEGVYTKSEIINAARNIVFSKKLSGGCNCLDTQAIIISKEWKQKEEFRMVLYEELKRQPNQPAYYPGSRERVVEMMEKYEKIGDDRAKKINCPKSTGVTNNTSDDVVIVECGSPGEANYEPSALLKEAFGPLLAIVELSGTSSLQPGQDYLNDIAVPFVNDKSNIMGSLSCSLHAPDTLDMRVVDRAVESLEYGAIGVNTPNFLGWLAACIGAVWGAHPSAKGRESGAGFGGNQYRIQNIAKTVIRGPKLGDKVMFDGANNPPVLILDAMTTMECSRSVFMGILKILHLFLVRAVEATIGMILPGGLGRVKND